jgi:class 3 adenylate cyclase
MLAVSRSACRPTGSRSRPARPLSPGQWTCDAHGDTSTVTVVCTTPSLAADRRQTTCGQPPRGGGRPAPWPYHSRPRQHATTACVDTRTAPPARLGHRRNRHRRSHLAVADRRRRRRFGFGDVAGVRRAAASRSRGGQRRRRYTAIGEQVGMAQRMESVAPPSVARPTACPIGYVC